MLDLIQSLQHQGKRQLLPFAHRERVSDRAMLASHQEVEGELDVDAAQLAKIVRDVARKGYAEVQSRQTRGVTNIAFPVRGPNGRAVAVLNVPYIERIDKKITPSIEAVKEVLRESAARLSLLMGYVADAETS